MPNECYSPERKSKTMQFSLSNLCQSWVLPQMKRALLWAFGLAQAVPTPALPPNPSLIWQLLPGLRNMPPGTFFWAPTFLLIASVPCVATVRTLPETSSQVMPAAHCHISSSPDFEQHTTHSHMRGGGGCSGLWVASGNKRRGIVGHAAQQKLSLCCSEGGREKKTGKVSEES